MKREHIEYFNSVIAKVKHSVNVRIPITLADHEQFKGHENALGICHGFKTPRMNDWSPEKITIDEYFVEECYKAEVEGNQAAQFMLELAGDTLIGVICHEIAHIYNWRHGKKHTELAQRLVARVECGEPHGMAA